MVMYEHLDWFLIPFVLKNNFPVAAPAIFAMEGYAGVNVSSIGMRNASSLATLMNEKISFLL
jgi:hypothetical protein